KMSFDDKNLFVADPAYQRGMWNKCNATRYIFTALDLDRRQIEQRLANAQRFFRVGLPLLGELNRRVWLGGRDDGQSHSAKIGRQFAVLGIEAHVVVGIFVCSLLIE